MGVVSWVVGPKDIRVSPWHFENGASSKIDDVLAEDGRLLHVHGWTKIIVSAPVPFWVYWGWTGL